MTPDELRARVRKVVLRTLGRETPARPDVAPASGTSGTPPAQAPPRSKLVAERDVRDLPYGSELAVAPGQLITPLARQAAMERRVTFVTASAPAVGAEPRPSPLPKVGTAPVALGADHGGYRLKEVLKELVAGLGHEVIDCGTGGTEAVDYPDFALAVAELVAQGRAERGILVDGAGIGSCMAANKVPGVRAALCYDAATAVNSREHNDANVLTLGAGLLGDHLARQIVETWLGTSFGGGRHARRVDKIMAIERRFTGQRS